MCLPAAHGCNALGLLLFIYFMSTVVNSPFPTQRMLLGSSPFRHFHDFCDTLTHWDVMRYLGNLCLHSELRLKFGFRHLYSMFFLSFISSAKPLFEVSTEIHKMHIVVGTNHFVIAFVPLIHAMPNDSMHSKVGFL